MAVLRQRLIEKFTSSLVKYFQQFLSYRTAETSKVFNEVSIEPATKR